MKKMLSLLLVLLLCLSLLSTPAFAAGPASGSCGKNVTWSFDESTGVLTISGTGAMDDFGWNSFPWYSYRSKITSVIIQDGVTEIGEFVFYGCNKLTSVTIPSSVISIGEYAFYDCGLTSVTIPSGVTSIGTNVFMSCAGLTNVSIPSSVTSIGASAFEGCKNLTSVTIPSSVTSIGNSAFFGCEKLADVTIPSSVTSIGGTAFSETPWLAGLGEFAVVNGILLEYQGSDSRVTIPSTITTIGTYAFEACANLTSVFIPGSVTVIDAGAFYSCTQLASITIPDSVITIGNSAFLCCESLTSVTFGNGLRVIDESAFRFCTGLTNVVIPDGVTTIGHYAFHGCDNLKSIAIPSTVTDIAWDAFSTHINSPEYVPIPGLTIYGVEGSAAEQCAKEYGFPFVATGTSSQPSAPIFTDVPSNEYYAAPVAWAVEKGITTGTSATTFTPGRICNNGEILTFLWRAYGEPKPSVDNPFTNLVGNEYYYQPALWAYEKGLISGGTFNAGVNCTRAMTVRYLWQAAGSPAVTAASSFTDIPTGADYAQAVVWAVQNEITTGTSTITFSPEKACTRAQIVTFLYRNLAN